VARMCPRLCCRLWLRKVSASSSPLPIPEARRLGHCAAFCWASPLSCVWVNHLHHVFFVAVDVTIAVSAKRVNDVVLISRLCVLNLGRLAPAKQETHMGHNWCIEARNLSSYKPGYSEQREGTHSFGVRNTMRAIGC